MKRALVALALCLTACKGTPARAPVGTTTADTTVPSKPVRIGVWMPPDPAANTYGGSAVRELIYPQLFRATPDGKWAPSLAAPGTDTTDPGATSARFRLRRAKWSDGTPITVADLRRTMDTRFVSAVDDPTPGGTVVVHFTQRLPTWRRLWSGLQTITPRRDGLFGGPYKVATFTNGLETVLATNDSYFGDRPSIGEVHLVLVPDPEVAARLMERGELDVIAPLAFPGRIARLRRVKGAHVLVGAMGRGGWTAAFVANPARLNLAQRMFLFDFANGPRFTDVLLHDEATPGTASAHPADTARPPFTTTPALTVPQESVPATVLLHAMQRTAHKQGFDFDLRASEFDRVLGAYAAGDFDALFQLAPPTLNVCWTCSYATVDAALAKQADAGDAPARAALRRKTIVEGYELPLWRERSVAAVRDGLDGVTLNPFDVAGPVWDLQHWSWH